MRIEWRDQQRRKIGRVQADPTTRPTRATIIEPGIHDPEREAFLQWEGALDDAGQLRKCLACGCEDLFRDKAFPQITGLVVVLAFVGGIVGALGLATNLPVLLLLIVVLMLDVMILLFSRRRLVCYRCRSSYHELPIARYHRTWDRSVADRYPVAPAQPEAPIPGSVSVTPARAASSNDRQPLTPAIAAPLGGGDLPLKEKNYFS